MPSDVIEPEVEPPEQAAQSAKSSPPPKAPAASKLRPDEILSSSSADELSVSLAQSRPDPLLGDYTSSDATRSDRTDASPGASPPGSYDALTALNLAAGQRSGESSRAHPAADARLALGIADSGPTPTIPKRADPGGREVEVEADDDDEPEARGASLAMVLLVSYASAVTLGLAWVLWTGRKVREIVEPEGPPTADARVDPGLRAGRSRRLDPPRPILTDHLVRVGETLELGAVEVTPVALTSGAIALERAVGPYQKKRGGENVLKLRLRIRNISPDIVFSPVDEAFLRDRVEGRPDTFIDLGPDKAPVLMYPLAIQSEWSIVGQDFRELEPGEVFQTLVVSAEGALDLVRKRPEFIWRIRLRTGIDRTEDIGVRVRPEQIEVEPAPKASPKPKPPDADATKGYRSSSKS